MTSGTESAPAPTRRGNGQLIALIEQAAMSNKEFARAVRATAVRHGRDAKCTHTSVQRWRDGRMSRAVPPELIAETLSRALGRIVSTTDIGMAGPSRSQRPLWTAEFLESPAELSSVMRALWVSDLEQEGAVRSEIPATALSGPGLHWLMADRVAAPVGRGTGREVTPADLAGFRDTLHAFDLIARRTGGAAARLPAVQYLHTSLTPLLTGRYPAETGRSLFGAVALAHLGIGRYTHDAGLHGLARRYLLLALCSAHQADDRLLGAHVLTTLAEHAAGAGDQPATANLVRAALGASSGSNPRARAALYAAQAHAQAARQDGEAATHSLAAASRGLAHAIPQDAPWLDYFGAAELADTALRCRLELGDFAAAPADFAAATAARSPDRLVDQVLARCLLATAYFRLGDPVQACTAVEAALNGAQGLQSGTVAAQLAQLATYLAPHRESPRAAALLRRIRRCGSPLGSPDTPRSTGAATRPTH
ncbi:hypothetical protein [Kitasatospora azatica]|uniref:hypothetical protein n=1 Tax=Kitasatospora azatica TaxID=58347 RepID=UPI00055B2037|nr:hypothetical protein [Kitasatospora azatica]